MSPDVLAPDYVARLPLLALPQVAVYLQLPSANAARMFARRAGLIPVRLGRAVRFTRLDIDRAIGLTHRR